MFTPKSGVAPAFEIVYFIRYEQADRFSKLLLEQKGVKTHFCKHSFDIIQHGKHVFKKWVLCLTIVKLKKIRKILMIGDNFQH